MPGLCSMIKAKNILKTVLQSCKFNILRSGSCLIPIRMNCQTAGIKLQSGIPVQKKLKIFDVQIKFICFCSVNLCVQVSRQARVKSWTRAVGMSPSAASCLAALRFNSWSAVLAAASSFSL